MSNSLAIATVTATLRNLLTRGLEANIDGINVTTQPPDKARDNNSSNQINLFLYHTELNAAWRNRDLPTQVKPGETGNPPLPLNLYYLITAYGQENEDVFSHILLGRAMSILHDHPLFGATELKDALPENDLHEQVERVRITFQPLSVDEMYKLWATFQTQYRISAAYQVSVVLIESTLGVKTPLPVLRRGREDRGVAVQSDSTPPLPPFPVLTAAQPPLGQPSVQLGDILTLSGNNLTGESVLLLFTNPRLTEPISVTELLENNATQIKVKLPSPEDPENPDPQSSAQWTAGFWSVSAVVTLNDGTENKELTTNELPFSLAPKITSSLPLEVERNVNGDATITLTCSPQIRPEQRVNLLLGDREIRREANDTQTDTLTFIVKKASLGKYPVRLRVDGVDSLLIDYQAKPPIFKDTEKVIII
ncbi:MAG: DUF4255 domain-containing protein [Potamolinea sp.]